MDRAQRTHISIGYLPGGASGYVVYIAKKREEFKKTYEDLEEEYALAKEMLSAHARVGLSLEAVAEIMGTTKSAISRLEAAGKHAPSLTTLKKYARAVGWHLEIKFVPEHAQQGS